MCQLLKNCQSRLTCDKTDYIIFTVIKMLIKGFQKLTLLDFPGRTACTVFTAGCNFRCPFCHNALLVTEQDDAYYDESEIFEHLERRKNVLDGVAVTGGEPLLQKDIERFLYEIKDMGYAVKLDTNGSFPEKLEGILELGIVDYVAMDIKNCPQKYPEATGLSTINVDNIKKSVDYLLKGTLPYEFRTTIVKELHVEKDIHIIGEWLKGAQKYFLQSYEESEFVIQKGFHSPDKETLLHFQALLLPNIPNTKIRGID